MGSFGVHFLQDLVEVQHKIYIHTRLLLDVASSKKKKAELMT